MSYVTPTTIALEAGNYEITMPNTVQSNGKTYNFLNWENASTNPIRQVALNADTTITANYEEYVPPPTKALLQIKAFENGTEVIANGVIQETSLSFQTPASIEVEAPASYTINVTYKGVTKTQTASPQAEQTVTLTFDFPATPIPNLLVPTILGLITIGTFYYLGTRNNKGGRV